MPSAKVKRRDSEPSYPKPIQLVFDLLRGRHAYSFLLPIALWLCDAVLCVLIIWKIAYTEIDWTAYMEQVKQFVEGERDYTAIKGGTGPLVYPGFHVYLYTGLYYLTNEGKDIFLAQQIFGVLYMLTLGIVMICYWKAKVPPYMFPLLILSKRLHSIFLLRCFNDGPATLLLFATILCLQTRNWTLASLFFTLGLATKMTLLLCAPAFVIILFLGRGFHGTLRLLWLMTQVQLLIGLPFLAKNWRGYLGRAFELSREFKFIWTVNWRMIGEETFLSKKFAVALLAGHVSVLMLFILTRWLKPAGKSLPELVRPMLARFQSPYNQFEELQVSSKVTPQFVMTTMLSANVIGLLFARSLHYQFYAYLAWSTPYLLWRASPMAALPLFVAQEWAWNTFPSTDASSSVVVAVLAITVFATYFGATEEMGFKAPTAPTKPQKKA